MWCSVAGSITCILNQSHITQVFTNFIHGYVLRLWLHAIIRPSITLIQQTLCTTQEGDLPFHIKICNFSCIKVYKTHDLQLEPQHVVVNKINKNYVEIKCQLDVTDDFYCRSYCLLNMMMGIMVPETCWASNKICNKNHLLRLVAILFPHINDDARSKPH